MESVCYETSEHSLSQSSIMRAKTVCSSNEILLVQSPPSQPRIIKLSTPAHLSPKLVPDQKMWAFSSCDSLTWHHHYLFPIGPNHIEFDVKTWLWIAENEILLQSSNDAITLPLATFYFGDLCFLEMLLYFTYTEFGSRFLQKTGDVHSDKVVDMKVAGWSPLTPGQLPHSVAPCWPRPASCEMMCAVVF